MIPPPGVRSLFLACLAPDEPQFRGIRRAILELGSGQRCHAVQWQGSALRLGRRRALTRLLVSGHGLEDRAGFAPSCPGQASFGPSQVSLPPGCSLYLLACFQGRPDLQEGWARGAGIPAANVQGCAGETDSALSTCLLLHLLEQGVERLERWFAAWLQANDALRPHFPRIRESYRRNAADPLATLGELADLARDTGTEQFVSVIRRHPDYLSGLLGAAGPDK